MRLPVRSLPGVGRRLGRRQRAVVLALAGAATALGMGAGSSHRDAQRHAVQEAGTRAVASATAAPSRAGAAYYRRTARENVPAKAAARFLPLYREAGMRYGVNWRLIASIHRQETAFSAEPSTYHGLNAFGCCAGPMQFNVTNGPVSTWKRYRHAFRDGRRPERYPHRTRSHPSIYDDFDAIMAAGALLSDSGADRSLSFGAWSAAYSYYGHDLFGVTYANQVLARAVAWQRDGFCANCGLNAGLLAKFEGAYGVSARLQLIAAERRPKKRKHRKDGRDKGERRDRRNARAGGEDGLDDRAPHLPPVRGQRLSMPPSAKNDAPPRPSPARPRKKRTDPTTPSPPTPTPPAGAPPPPEPAPPPSECDPVRQLLGC